MAVPYNNSVTAGVIFQTQKAEVLDSSGTLEQDDERANHSRP